MGKGGPLLTCIVFASLLISPSKICSAENPVKAPILQGDVDVHLVPFAKLPRENGTSAKIVAMRAHEDGLLVCTKTRLHFVKGDGSRRLLLDLEMAIPLATGRRLNTMNRVHGGLRGVAVHPSFNQTGLLYTSCMEDRPKGEKLRYLSDVPNPVGADSVVIEWRYDAASGVVDPNSYRQVLRVGMPVFDHPIKEIDFFGGLLYIAHGDGSVKSATAGGGQRRDALGKILRIDPLRRGSRPYTVPAGNVFARTGGMLAEVYALGFRNPHTMCFDRLGVLFAVDVGRDNVEEVNVVQNGGNYGWSAREGTFVHRAGGGLLAGVGPLPRDDARLGLEYPAAQVGHAGAAAQALAGACPVQNGSPLDGLYLYADFPVSGRLFYSETRALLAAVTRGDPRRLTQARTWRAGVVFHRAPGAAGARVATLADVVRAGKAGRAGRADVRFGRGARGELYVSSKTNGRIYLITSSLPGGPGGRTAR